uniref:Uncharacterized protein n=1 Tax=Brassica oleracea var. oleracea TaxID=109376 RepID=A0A0D3BEB4_BRAOL
MLDYKVHDENSSLYNTPPCFRIYMRGFGFWGSVGARMSGKLSLSNKLRMRRWCSPRGIDQWEGMRASVYNANVFGWS